MKKNIFFLFATMFAICYSLSTSAQNDDRYKNHITGGYDNEMISAPVLVLQPVFADSADISKPKKEPLYFLHHEPNIIRFNGDDAVYSVRIKKYPRELSQLCKKLGISASYESRMANIVLPLCMQGVVLFGKETDPYFLEEDIVDLKKEHGAYWDCYFYRGTEKQNATLLRNINANLNLFQDGKLIPGAYLRWKIVE